MVNFVWLTLWEIFCGDDARCRGVWANSLTLKADSPTVVTCFGGTRPAAGGA